jgi:hypothetical protein
MRTPAPLLLSAFLLVGCSSMAVDYDFDPAADLSAWGSYNWIDREVAASQETDRIIRTAIESELAVRGFYKSTGGEPDFLITYSGGLQDTFDVTSYGYSYWHGYPVGSEVTVVRGTEGTLLIDIVDRRTNRLVWQGWATGAANEAGRNQDLAREAVSRILANFPPR